MGDASGTVQQNVVFTAVQFVAEQWGVMGLDHFANARRHQLILATLHHCIQVSKKFEKNHASNSFEKTFEEICYRIDKVQPKPGGTN